MSSNPIRIKSALISVFHKEGIEAIARELVNLGIRIISTGGTYEFLNKIGISAVEVESLTGYPSILGGRVKTLHPAVFGGILLRRDNHLDTEDAARHSIEEIDLVIVDLYPFEETVASAASDADIIEKIDIGGVSLIRAAAKNYADVLVISSKKQYASLHDDILIAQKGESTLEQRKNMALAAFGLTAGYDYSISKYFDGTPLNPKTQISLRYGENPHQEATFTGNLHEVFEQLNGKELSYNNLVDINAGLELIQELPLPSCVVIKHTNPCGAATGSSLTDAWKKAYAADTVSAFGGILIFNECITEEVAQEIDQIFFEVIVAPDYHENALTIFSRRKNRIVIKLKDFHPQQMMTKTLLNGKLEQRYDGKMVSESDLTFVTERRPSQEETKDMLFANIIVKHAKSNAIVLVKDSQLIGIGVGQTSRVDALKQAIQKAENFGFKTEGAVMASDAFFPFPDCVEIADQNGIRAVIQPGGSVRDGESVAYCNQHNMAMVTTGYRHFKH